jgi:hypothetical protein
VRPFLETADDLRHYPAESQTQDQRAAAQAANAKAHYRSYMWIRTVVGLIGLLLPTSLLAGDDIFMRGHAAARGSMSAYYHTSMRDLFVGSLAVIGILLITYMFGIFKAEFWTSLIAGVALIVVAGFPTSRDRQGLPDNAPYCGDPVPRPPGCTDLMERVGETKVATIHAWAAGIALVALGVTAILFALSERRRGNLRMFLFEGTCGLIIFTALGVVASGSLWSYRIPVFDVTPLFFGEVVTVVAFAAGWLMLAWDFWWPGLARFGRWLRRLVPGGQSQPTAPA